MSVPAIVLAAGEGKRMRPLTLSRPKPMLPAGGEPLLARLVRQLVVAGVTDVTLVVSHAQEAVRAHFGDGSRLGAKIRYVERAPRGTGDAVRAAAPSGAALVLNGDIFLPEGALARVLSEGPGALVAHEVADPRGLGVLELANGRASRVVEKSPTPPSTLANAGVYFLPEGFTRHLAELRESPRGEIEITDALNSSFAETAGWRVSRVDSWLDVARPWDLLAAAERALAEAPARVEGTVEPGATLKGAVHVAKGALVKSGTYIEGPVHVGEGCVVGPNAYLRPNTVLLPRVKIGNAVEIKGSILFEDTHVGHLSYVGDSVIGARVNLGAGTLVANLRHDGKSVPVATQGERVDSGRRKLGVVLADDVHTGINTSLNVGVVLGPGATTMPGEVVMKSRY